VRPAVLRGEGVSPAQCHSQVPVVCTPACTGGDPATGGDPGTGGSNTGDYPCNGDTSGYNAVATLSGSTWTVQNGGSTVYTGNDMESAMVPAYGIEDITIGEVVAENTGYCGLLLNYTRNAEVGSVTGNNCGAGTGYAAFRIANEAGPNIHVGEVYARDGGRGIFSVSGSGGLTVDRVDIANTGNNAILLEDCYDTTIAADSGTVTGPGSIRIAGSSSNITIQNLTVVNSAINENPCGTNITVSNNTLQNSSQSICS